MSLRRRPVAARAFALATSVANKLQSLPNRITPPAFRLLQIGSAFWQSRVLYVAAQLDLATVLADETATAEDLAARVEVDADALFRLLRLLAAIGIFEETAPRVFRNNKLSDALRSDRPSNVRAMVLVHNSPAMSRPWFEQLEQGVRRGQSPFRLEHGVDLYAYMDAHPDFDALFAAAMDSVESLSGDSFATEFDWRAFDRIIDIGGSKGAKAIAILKRHPHLSALVIDRALTIRNAEEYWRQHGVANGLRDILGRLRFAAGDALDAVPAAASSKDIYLLSAVLHGFDDDTCVRILRNVGAAATAKGATIAVLELVLPEHRADLAAASFDMQMFMATHGRERSRSEWSRLFERSGVRWVETVNLASFGKILVLRQDA